jgi:hypothetical protein
LKREDEISDFCCGNELVLGYGAVAGVNFLIWRLSYVKIFVKIKERDGIIRQYMPTIFFIFLKA